MQKSIWGAPPILHQRRGTELFRTGNYPLFLLHQEDAAVDPVRHFALRTFRLVVEYAERQGKSELQRPPWRFWLHVRVQNIILGRREGRGKWTDGGSVNIGPRCLHFLVDHGSTDQSDREENGEEDRRSVGQFLRLLFVHWKLAGRWIFRIRFAAVLRRWVEKRVKE